MQSEDNDHEKISETECSQERPLFIELNAINEIPRWESYSCPRHREALRALDRLEESQQETPQSHPPSCECPVPAGPHFEPGQCKYLGET